MMMAKLKPKLRRDRMQMLCECVPLLELDDMRTLEQRNACPATVEDAC